MALGKSHVALLNFIVYTNVWVSLVAALLYCQTQYLFLDRVYLPEVLVVFFLTLASYSFQRLFLSGDQPQGYEKIWKIRRPFLIGQTAIGVGVALWFFPMRWLENWWLFGVLCLISGVYAIRLKGGKSVREVPYLKIFLIAISWALCTGVLALDSSTPLTQKGVVFFVYFLWVFALTLPFDYRDRQQPFPVTIPKTIGLKNTKLIIIGCLASFLLLAQVPHTGAPRWAWLLGIALVYCTVLQMGPKKGNLFYNFWVEGSIVFPFGCLVLAEYLLSLF